MSPIKRMTSAFSSAGDRSSRFPGVDMPFQNLKSLYVEHPDLSIFTRAVAPCLPYSCRQQNLRCPDFCPYYITTTSSKEAGGKLRDGSWPRPNRGCPVPRLN